VRLLTRTRENQLSYGRKLEHVAVQLHSGHCNFFAHWTSRSIRNEYKPGCVPWLCIIFIYFEMGQKCGASLSGWSKLGVTGSAHHSSDPQGQIESKVKSTGPKRGLSLSPGHGAWPVFWPLPITRTGRGRLSRCALCEEISRWRCIRKNAETSALCTFCVCAHFYQWPFACHRRVSLPFCFRRRRIIDPTRLIHPASIHPRFRETGGP
jgi:hypothetical protein